MQLQGKALRVTIYIGEGDRYQGKSLYMALLHFLKQEGAAGATVGRGLAGFGAHSRIRTATLVDLSSDLPIRVDWVDQPELVERLLPQVRQMVNDGLITVETVDVVQYAPGRRPDPLAQPVQNVMRTEVMSVTPATPLTEIVNLLLQKRYRSLPVVAEDGRIRGIITEGDLLRRTGLAARFDLQQEIGLVDWQQQLAKLRAEGQTAGSLMTSPVIAIASGSTLHQAVKQMVDHNLKRLPVVADDGRLAGWISRIDILRTVEYHEPVAEREPELVVDNETATATTVSELMYRDMPTVTPQATLEEVLQALEQDRRRRAIVVDEQQRVVGIISDGDLLRRSQPPAHPGLLARLRHLVGGQSPADPPALLDASETAADLMSTPVVTIAADALPADALRLMVNQEIKRLPVVDENGRLVGLLDRASLLRGLLNSMGPPSVWGVVILAFMAAFVGAAIV
jgi:CBS domain-containing protein